MMIQRTGLSAFPSALKKTNKALSKVLEKLSTAERINRASDDAAGLSIAEQLSSQVRGFNQASNNIADAMSALNIADGASNEIQSMVQRQRELAIQASNDTLTNEQRQTLDVEYQQLTQEINRIAEGTEFNTQEVADGTGLSDGDAVIQAGANAGDEVILPVVDMTAAGLGIAGTGIGDRASATAALATLDSANSAINEQRSTVGAFVNRFEHAGNNLAVAEVNTQAAESVLRDQDMAMGLAELTRNRLLTEVGHKAFSHFREISANHILTLLQ